MPFKNMKRFEELSHIENEQLYMKKSILVEPNEYQFFIKIKWYNLAKVAQKSA